MSKQRRSFPVFLRYALIQLPGIALLVLVLFMLQRWVDIPMWLLWSIVLLSIAKDIIMFPMVRRAYEKNINGCTNSLIGSSGTAVDSLSPSGYIRIRGELWKAEVVPANSPIMGGERVRVLGSSGLTLLVQPEKDPAIGQR